MILELFVKSNLGVRLIIKHNINKLTKKYRFYIVTQRKIIKS